MSVIQLLSTEKQIRFLSLLQQQALISALQAKDQIYDRYDKKRSSSIDPRNGIWLKEHSAFVILKDFPQSGAPVTYFVIGYIGLTVVRGRKCSACSDLLISSKEANSCSVDEEVPTEFKQLVLVADCGGLCKPAE